MVDNIPKNEYEQKQRQNYLIDMTRRRKVAEADAQEEEEDTPEYYANNVSYLPEEQALQTEVKHKQRISRIMGVMLMASAVLVDVAELVITDTGLDIFAFGIPNFLLSICATVVFAIWFQMLSVPYSSNTKRFWASTVTYIAEIVPGLDWSQFWFVWTLGMVVIVGMVRMEDKGEEPSILGGLSEGIALLLTSNPLNPVGMSNGIVLSALNKARRSVKNRIGVGQADWKKEQEQRRVS